MLLGWNTSTVPVLDSIGISQTLVIVSPPEDLLEHDLGSPKCWCLPKVERFRNGNLMITHYALDERDLFVDLEEN